MTHVHAHDKLLRAGRPQKRSLLVQPPPEASGSPPPTGLSTSPSRTGVTLPSRRKGLRGNHLLGPHREGQRCPKKPGRRYWAGKALWEASCRTAKGPFGSPAATRVGRRGGRGGPPARAPGASTAVKEPMSAAPGACCAKALGSVKSLMTLRDFRNTRYHTQGRWPGETE